MNKQPFDIESFEPLPGISLIEASAGTGKTYSITHLICRLIKEGYCEIGEALVLTFTEAATQELKDRVRKGLIETKEKLAEEDYQQQLRLQKALAQFESASIFTIHGFCNRLCREFFIEINLGTEFAILKDDREFKKETQLEAVRQIQLVGKSHPLLIPACVYLGYNASTIEQSLTLKSAGLPGEDPKLPESEWSDLSNQLQVGWNQEGERIRQILLGPDAPIARRKGCYKLPQLSKILDRIDAWSNGTEASIRFFNDIESLSREVLSSQLKKNQSLPAFLCFSLADQLIATLEDIPHFLANSVLQTQSNRIQQLIHQEQQLRFDDLLETAYQITQTSAATTLNQRYKIGLVDEFQDTDPLQFSILQNIFLASREEASIRPLILIGDPKQAIYGFRGGDIFAYHAASKKARRNYYLDTNWRSATKVNEAINSLLQAGPEPFVFDWIDYQPVQTAPDNQKRKLCVKAQDHTGLQITLIESALKDHQVCRIVAQDLKDYLAGQPMVTHEGQPAKRVNPGDVAILVPDNRKGTILREELSRVGIVSTIQGGASVFQSVEAHNLFHVLIALESPRDLNLVKGAFMSQLFDPHLLWHAHEGNEAGIEALSNIHKVSEVWKTRGLAKASALGEEEFGWSTHLASSADPERSLANHMHLIELLLDYEHQHTPTTTQLIHWLREKIQEPDKNAQEELVRLDRESVAVKIQTIHKSKGLEYPIVWLPFLPRPNPHKLDFPLQFHGSNEKLKTCFHKSHFLADDKEAFFDAYSSEAKRVLYVALTRAALSVRVYLDPESYAESIIGTWLSGNEPHQDLETLIRNADQKSGGAISLAIKSDLNTKVKGKENKDTASSQPLVLPKKRAVPSPLERSSFSRLLRRSESHNTPEWDEPFSTNILPEIQSETDAPPSLFSFDKGTQAGLMFHDLLERVDFSDSKEWESLTRAVLEKFGYRATTWTPVLMDFIDAFSSTHFTFADGICFTPNQIDPSQLFQETEFTFPAKPSPDRWKKWRQAVDESEFFKNLNYQLPDLMAAEEKWTHYFTGIIDLWFEANGNIFLLDWKSNYLGPSFDNYSPNALVDSMNEHHYHLQYLLYVCALNRYMRLIRHDYNYDRDFGGVIYLYIRGFRGGNDRSGIFFEKPPAQLVQKVEEVFE
ncbi:MAG: UvrD-helicase domain-containing protein [Opitutales bacterium]|nr:UvrD-helicase domain-containing protein [Opitutales bacterium]